MVCRLKRSSLAAFSDRFVKHQKLPNGTHLRLWNNKADKFVRSDFMIKRKAINKKNIITLDDDSTVRELLDEATRLISTEISIRGYELLLFSPHEERIYGNTMLKNARSYEPKIPEDEEETLELFSTFLENKGLDTLSEYEIKKMHRIFNSIFENKLDIFLLKNESNILKESFS